MTQAQPDERPVPLVEPDERLAEIRTKSAKRYDAYDSDTRWLLRYVDMLRKDNGQLRKRRTSFEHKMFTVATLFMGFAVVGAIAYNLYLQPGQELFPGLPGCTLESIYTCAAWLWDFSKPLMEHPH
jgi:hypothetical protein